MIFADFKPATIVPYLQTMTISNPLLTGDKPTTELKGSYAAEYLYYDFDATYNFKVFTQSWYNAIVSGDPYIPNSIDDWGYDSDNELAVEWGALSGTFYDNLNIKGESSGTYYDIKLLK
jgi:hypothetical protein